MLKQGDGAKEPIKVCLIPLELPKDSRPGQITGLCLTSWSINVEVKQLKVLLRLLSQDQPTILLKPIPAKFKDHIRKISPICSFDIKP